MIRLPLLLLWWALAALPLAACAPTVRIPEIVDRAVPVPCVDAATRPVRPALRSEDELFAMPRGTRTLAAYADLRAYDAYTAELEAAVEGCSRIPQ